MSSSSKLSKNEVEALISGLDEGDVSDASTLHIKPKTKLRAQFNDLDKISRTSIV